MPAFNHGKFVKDALVSVYNQSYGEIELIIVDDCSTDNTLAVIQTVCDSPKFQRRFRRVSVFANDQNRGAHNALNVGLQASNGEFITFINSDDIYLPSRLANLSSLCRPDEIFIAFSKIKLIDEDGNPVENHPLKKILEDIPEQLIKELPSASFGFLRYQLTGSTGNIFLSRRLLNIIGGFSALKYCHDWDYMMRSISIIEPVFVPQEAYLYRIHSANSFSTLGSVALEESERVLMDYFMRVASGQVQNKEAPTPFNWPFVFDIIARRFEVYDTWIRV